jgi:iron complex transport system permease protein
MVVSLCIGAKPLSIDMLWNVLVGKEHGLAETIILEGRLPRTLNGLFVGMALGTSGALIQAITRNPLAEPGILGVNLGASLAIAIAIVFLGATQLTEFFFYSAIGALLASVLVYFVGSTGAGKVDPLKLTLAGVAIGAAFAGFSSSLTLFNPSAFDQIRFWSVGSLDSRTLMVPLFIAPVVIFGCFLAMAISPALNAFSLGDSLATALGSKPARVQIISLISITLLCGAATAAALISAFMVCAFLLNTRMKLLEMGDDTAAALGVPVNKTRLILMFVGVSLTAVATAITGPIAFISLAAPQIARQLENSASVSLSSSAYVGALLLLCADFIAQHGWAGSTLPVGLVTISLGGIYLVYLITREGKL